MQNALSQGDSSQGIRLIRLKSVIEMLGISKTYFYMKFARDPQFPAAVKLSGDSKMVRWVEHEVAEYIANLGRWDRLT